MVFRVALAIATLMVVMMVETTSAALIVRCRNCHLPHDLRMVDCVQCHHGNPATSRKNLAHTRLITGVPASFQNHSSSARREGERLIKQLGCRRCHISFASGAGVATNLDSLLPNANLLQLHQAIRVPAVYMPLFSLSTYQREAIITALLAGGFQFPVQASQHYRVVFSQGEQASEGPRVFLKQCGGCHKALTARKGGVGHGTTGPNLSGLFTPWYPSPDSHGVRWTPERLNRWLKNPRSIQPYSSMPPRKLSAKEFEEIVSLLTIEIPMALK